MLELLKHIDQIVTNLLHLGLVTPHPLQCRRAGRRAMQARTLLAVVATLQLIAICLNFWLAAYVIWLTLPFALAA